MSLTKKCLSLVLTATFAISAGLPALALDKDKPIGAKGLFYKQMDSPSKNLNTGIQYWIELNRNGKKVRVTNKQEFRSGDEIKFNVKSNIKGYAYILLKTGSRGEQSVLFPDPGYNEDNKITPGRIFSIPANGALTFDENPGLEKVTLLVSRYPIDAQAYLNKSNNQNATLIASAMTGAKDLVPAKVLVSIKPITNRNLVVAKHNVNSSKPKPKKTKTTKTRIAKKPRKKRPVKKPRKTQRKKIASKPRKRSIKHSTDEGTVTVVSTSPKNILHIDVDLHHI